MYCLVTNLLVDSFNCHLMPWRWVALRKSGGVFFFGERERERATIQWHLLNKEITTFSKANYIFSVLPNTNFFFSFLFWILKLYHKEPLHKIEKRGFSYTASCGLLFNKFWEFSKQYETFVTYVSHLLKKKKVE